MKTEETIILVLGIIIAVFIFGNFLSGGYMMNQSYNMMGSLRNSFMGQTFPILYLVYLVLLIMILVVIFIWLIKKLNN